MPQPKVCYYGGRAMRCLGNGVTWQNAELPQSTRLQSTSNYQSVSPGSGQDLATLGQSAADVNRTLLVGLVAVPHVIALMVVIVGIAAWRQWRVSTVGGLLALVALGGILLYGGGQ